MNDFEGLLATDYGFKPQAKSVPLSTSKGPARSSSSAMNSNPLAVPSTDDYDSFFGSSASKPRESHQNVGGLDGFADVFGGPPKYNGTSESRIRGDGGFNFDSMFSGTSNSGAVKSSSSGMPKYDKPVYDDDIFNGVPGLKSSSTVNYDDVFSSTEVLPPNGNAFDDLLGSFSGSGSESKSLRMKGSERVEKGADSFVDLLPGFGGSSPRNHRKMAEASMPSKSTVDTNKTTTDMMEDPFVGIASTSPPEVSSQRPSNDPLEDIGKYSMSGTSIYDVPSAKGVLVDDIDPLDSLGKSVPAYSSEVNDRREDKSFSRKVPSTSGKQTLDSNEPTDKSSTRSSVSQPERQRHGSYYPEPPQTMHDAPTVSYSFHDPVGQTGSPSSYVDPGLNTKNSYVDMSSRSGNNLESTDDVWLTVSEIPLFTQPTSAPPPSRPPPPRPAKLSKDESSFACRSARKKVNDFSSVPNSTQYFESPKSVSSAMRGSAVSHFDQLEDFAMGRTHTNTNEPVDAFSGQDVETNSDAAASAAAMKEAMDRAEAKFRHAKEVRERENAKAARSREAMQPDKYEKTTEDAQERSRKEKQERLEHERQQREREDELIEERRRVEEERERFREIEREREEMEREQRKIERERAREIENERLKARQAVERATREARERAALDARQKAEKAAVDKVNSDARQRAERAAVQRAQAEARERAAADAKERAEKAAAEARERANAEAKERTTRAEVDAQNRAQRAAVERATAEARQRAAAEARERAAAAAAAKVNIQKSEDDLESFFGMGARPSSAPKARANSSDPLFDTQLNTRQGPDVAKRTSSSMRKVSSTTNINEDLSSIFGAVPSSGDFQDVEGESEERRRARLERYQRTHERAVKALAEKNQRDLQVQREQAERDRIGETLDAEIKRWAAGKEGNLRALLSTLQYVLWPECGWQPVSLTDLIIGASVKKAYRKATLCIHPDKVQQKGATLQQKYVAEKVFDLLKEAWNKFNSEELF